MKAIQEWASDGINDPIAIDGNRVFDVYIDESVECAQTVVDGVTYYEIDGWCWDQDDQS
jgi:hypothetical protein